MSEIIATAQEILGYLLMKPSLIASDEIQASDFPEGVERMVFEAISDLWEDDHPEVIDPLLLLNRLDHMSNKEEYISHLSGAFKATPGTFRIRLNHLREEIEKKRLGSICWEIGEGKAEPDLDALDEIITRIRTIRAEGESPIPSILPLSDVEPREVPWLWENYLPLGRLILISGDPGSQKTFFCLDLACRLSKGMPWADGSQGYSPSGTLFMGVEDDIHDTIRVRVDSLGGDPSKIMVYNPECPIVPNLQSPEGLKRFEDMIQKTPDCRLAIIDPIVDFSGKARPNQTEDVRALLTPLAKIAAKHQIALIFIGHLNKAQSLRAIYRAAGSTGGWLGKVRAAFLIFRDIDDPIFRHFVPLKANSAKIDPPQLEFRIRDGRMEIEVSEEEVNVDDHMTAEQRKGPKPEEREKAVEWLKEFMAQNGGIDCEIPAKTVYRAAQDARIAIATLKRAKKEAGFESKMKNRIWVFCRLGN